MARKLILETVIIEGLPQGPMTLDYGETMEAIIRSSAGQGVTLDEVMRATSALEAVVEARRKRATEIVLTDDQWKILVEKTNIFRFPFVDSAIAEFGRLIREAPEVGVETRVEAPPAKPRDADGSRAVPRH